MAFQRHIVGINLANRVYLLAHKRNDVPLANNTPAVSSLPRPETTKNCANMSFEAETTFPLSSTKEEPPVAEHEEVLPLYGEDELLSHIAAVPSVHATPHDICDFLTYLLVKKRGFAQEHARRVAAKWTVGSGLELRQYNPTMFFQVFGREDGWILYREVKVGLWREKRFVVRHKMWFSTLLAIIWETVMISLLATETGSDGMLAFALFGAIVGAILCLVLLIMLCLGTSATKMIERELKACARPVAS
ncbi:hypothetical protein Q7P37_008588 [Cladosporium fusiforme]